MRSVFEEVTARPGTVEMGLSKKVGRSREQPKSREETPDLSGHGTEECFGTPREIIWCYSLGSAIEEKSIVEDERGGEMQLWHGVFHSKMALCLRFIQVAARCGACSFAQSLGVVR